MKPNISTGQSIHRCRWTSCALLGLIVGLGARRRARCGVMGDRERQYSARQGRLRETRPLTTVIRPDNAQIHTSGGWCWDVENGTTDENQDPCNRRLTEGRGWYDCFEYKTARTDEWTYPYGGIPAGVSYAIPVSGKDGAGGTTVVDRHWVTLDPNFHAGSAGTFLLDHPGAHTKETLTIPGNLLTPGVHSIFVMAEEADNCTAIVTPTSFPNQIAPQNGRVSGGIRIPIVVN
jgi:hypothetical protein